MLQFADDAALVTHGKNIHETVDKLQSVVNTSESWLNKWRLEANPNKSQLMVFNHTISNASPTITIAGHHVAPTPSVKYLGIHIDHKTNFKHHTNIMKKKIQTRAKNFRSLTYKNQGISTAIASKIYKTICRPLLEYGHTIYLNARNPTLKTIQVAETSSLRIITKIRHPDNPLHNPPNQLLYRRTNIQPIKERFTKLSEKFAKKDHNLELIRPMMLSRRENIQPKFKFPERTLSELLTSLAEIP